MQRFSGGNRKCQKGFGNVIYRSKKYKWEELSQDVKNDLWGLGYKIVMCKFSTKTANPVLERYRMRNIVKALFTQIDLRKWRKSY